jgi:pseudouridine-5'-phosphate glycosidase
MQSRRYTPRIVRPVEPAPRRLAPEVEGAVADGNAVVALETTLLVHGLPPVDAVRIAGELDDVVRAHGAVPARTGVLNGTAVIGLTMDETRSLIERRDMVGKLSTKDLGLATAGRRDGATTIAATIALATGVGIDVMATGGIGGVHLGASETFDESADLAALARTPALVVASGVKSILDVAATLERLDSLGVPVVGYRSSAFPGFYVRDSGLTVQWSVDSPTAAAAAFLAHRSFADGAMVLANAVPEAAEMDRDLHAKVLADALHDAHSKGISGAEVTPFLLAHFAQATEGVSVSANVALVLDNAALAAEVACAIATARRNAVRTG